MDNKKMIPSKELEMKLEKIKLLVLEQAEDEGLWCDAGNVVEAYLQQELRKLHKIVEEDSDA